MCSRMAAKLMNSSDESSMGSAVYFSNSVFTENLYAEERKRFKKSFKFSTKCFVASNKVIKGID